ncbi:PRC-barrel domain-containing protein [Oricola sp.]|uniref:PRC-barrel domain-containing protein n=1 Tax=Oricola sp. TaxID=1979950 RepID=UPI0025E62E60|nr:PRC-barrel domain-containing protein [Oricola sp.]MCI5074319.1 PRC-barrel domain-containing protein [Oricola sp.]
MTNTHTTFGTFTFQSAKTRNAAEARGMRRALALAIVSATVFAGTALVSASQATAGQFEQSYQVAYADFNTERFGGILDDVYPQEEEHELNDAWMGMQVLSADGVVLGYVSDAFVNEDGSIDELVIEPEGGDSPLYAPVYLPIRYAALTPDFVSLSLGATQATALLTPATDLARLSN